MLAIVLMVVCILVVMQKTRRSCLTLSCSFLGLNSAEIAGIAVGVSLTVLAIVLMVVCILVIMQKTRRSSGFSKPSKIMKINPKNNPVSCYSVGTLVKGVCV